MAEKSQREMEQARRLAASLLAAPDDQACQACLDRVEEYVAAQVAGKPYAQLFPDVAQHLDACVACAESYALLYEAQLRAAQHDSLPLPARIPAPDLSFLAPRPVAGAALSDRAAQLRAALTMAVEQTGERLRLRLTQALLAASRPPVAPALAVRGNQPRLMFDLTLDSPHPTIERLQLSASAADDAAERGDLRVQVALQGREWPDLAGVAITLTLGAEQRAALTDPWGETVFAGVPLALLEAALVEVELPPAM